MLRVLHIVEGTSVDGPGLRTSIYLAGCNHRCPGCHNPDSWNFMGGEERTLDELMQVIAYNEAPVTFSGGDPMYQAAGFAELARAIHRRTNKDIWCFTGFRFEDLIQHDQRELLEQLDVLVDGPYVAALRDPDLLFRGSSNQRIIDVQASLFASEVVLWQQNA